MKYHTATKRSRDRDAGSHRTHLGRGIIKQMLSLFSAFFLFSAFYLSWESIEAKIVRPNILATNGVIHVVDRLLLSTPYQMTTTPTTTEKQVSSKNRNSASLSATFITLTIAVVTFKFNTVYVMR